MEARVGSQQLTDVDFLVGLSDATRQGALRFRATPDGEFFGASTGVEVPKLIELPRLLHAADAAGRDDDFAAIKALLDAGTGSLGGARPKASVRDGERLLIAKFPHPDDQWDVMAWEKTTLDLAAKAGIRVPETTLTKVDGRSVLLLDRFDRQGPGRIPYLSAMTLLEARDGDSHDYTEIAETPRSRVSHNRGPARAMASYRFSILVNNTDDHLRNHGLIHEPGGWRLSPAFDMNPNPDTAAQRQTAVAGSYTREDALESLRAYGKAFRLTTTAANQILHQVTSAVTHWRGIATANGIRSNELTLFADTFRSPAGRGTRDIHQAGIVSQDQQMRPRYVGPRLKP